MLYPLSYGGVLGTIVPHGDVWKNGDNLATHRKTCPHKSFFPKQGHMGHLPRGR